MVRILYMAATLVVYNHQVILPFLLHHSTRLTSLHRWNSLRRLNSSSQILQIPCSLYYPSTFACDVWDKKGKGCPNDSQSTSGYVQKVKNFTYRQNLFEWVLETCLVLVDFNTRFTTGISTKRALPLLSARSFPSIQCSILTLPHITW